MRKRAVAAATFALVAVFALAACKSMSSEELKSSIQVTVTETKWVKKYFQPWPPRLILVPQISFTVKNTGSKPLEYVFFNGVFKFHGEAGNLGDQYLEGIHGQGLPPGGESGVITLTSNYGVEGKTVASFNENPAWKPVICRLFARSKGSPMVALGEYDISRTIDFQPPAAPAPKPKDKEGVPL